MAVCGWCTIGPCWVSTCVYFLRKEGNATTHTVTVNQAFMAKSLNIHMVPGHGQNNSVTVNIRFQLASLIDSS